MISKKFQTNNFSLLGPLYTWMGICWPVLVYRALVQIMDHILLDFKNEVVVRLLCLLAFVRLLVVRLF